MRYFSNAIGEEGNEKPPHEFHLPRKQLRDLSLVSATLEIEYTTQNIIRRVEHTLKTVPDKACGIPAKFVKNHEVIFTAYVQRRFRNPGNMTRIFVGY